jgi:hypothetical protein
LGTWAYEEFAQFIQTQCRKVIIILSPDFIGCPECEFQSTFATGLAIEQRNRRLIPLIYKRCELPPIIRMLTKIDMTRGISEDSEDWSLKRLVNSIKYNETVYRKSHNYLALQELPSNSPQIVSIRSIPNESLISLPSVCPIPTAPPMMSINSVNNSIISETLDTNERIGSASNLSEESNSAPKKINHKTWIQTIKQKFKVSS